MPVMLDPSQANYIAVPPQAKPVGQPAQQQAPQQAQAAAPAPPKNPFMPAKVRIPSIILPHEQDDNDEPVQQERPGTAAKMSMDSQAFDKDIALHPDDDAPKLIYSDWLEEHGKQHLSEAYRRSVSQDGQYPWYGTVSHNPTRYMLRPEGHSTIHIALHPASDGRKMLDKDFAHVKFGSLLSPWAEYETDDASHIHDLMVESGASPILAAEAHSRMGGDPSDYVHLGKNMHGPYYLRPDNSDWRSVRWFHQPHEFYDLAKAFGWKGDPNDIDSVRSFLDDKRGSFIRNPGFTMDESEQPTQQSRGGRAVKMMHDIQMFGDAIKANPGDDAHRLIMADYLQENGYEATAHAARLGETEDVSNWRSPLESGTRVGTASGWIGDEAHNHRRPNLMVSTYRSHDNPSELFHDIAMSVPSTSNVGGGKYLQHIPVATIRTSDHDFVRSLLSDLGERHSIGDDRHLIWDALDRLPQKMSMRSRFAQAVQLSRGKR